MIKIEIKDVQLVPVADIKRNPKNRNKHPKEQIEELARHYSVHGMRTPIIVSNQSGFITAGDGRFQAALKAKMTHVPVSFQDFETPEKEFAFGVADNGLSLWSELDLIGINEDAQCLPKDFNLADLGIKDFSLVEAEVLEPGCDEDAVPEYVEPKTKLGDLYQLGNHRLLCGDSTNAADFDKLMNGGRADITFTSPPYNVGRTPNGNEQKYLNDSDNKEQSEYVQFLVDFTGLCLAHSDFVFVNIQSLSGNKVGLIDFLHELKTVYADTMIWDKMTAEPAMAQNCLNSQFEYIHVFSQRANRIIGKKPFRGTISNIYQFNSRKDKEFASVHKATFPVAFAENFIDSFSVESVLEPFGGSGTTMIAAEKLKRKSFLMELEPKYCDIIVARWEKYTGQKAELING